jgi:aryl-alcohol dehydrogenase-like predicted oxidoreductase
MIYRNMPKTDLQVSSICMGGVTVIDEHDKDYCFNLLDKYIELGGNFIDTANIYGKWLSQKKNTSELNIGAWIKERKNRHKLIIGTKGGHPHIETMSIGRLSKEEVANDLEESLKALGTDYVDLYWLHRDDENLAVPYIIEYLNKFIEEGKIRYFGLSNWKANRITEALDYAKQRRISGPIANQMMWSLATINKDNLSDKTLVCMDDETFNLHKDCNITAIPYSSQANGFFDKLKQQGSEIKNEKVKEIYFNEENLNRCERVSKLASELNRSITEISLGYLISQPFTTVPIIGSRTLEQLESSLKAGDLNLNEEMIRFLEGK